MSALHLAVAWQRSILTLLACKARFACERRRSGYLPLLLKNLFGVAAMVLANEATQFQVGNFSPRRAAQIARSPTCEARLTICFCTFPLARRSRSFRRRCGRHRCLHDVSPFACACRSLVGLAFPALSDYSNADEPRDVECFRVTPGGRSPLPFVPVRSAAAAAVVSRLLSLARAAGCKIALPGRAFDGGSSAQEAHYLHGK